MSGLVSVEWLRDTLQRHDPVAAWGHSDTATDYASEAELAIANLHEVLGLGHARTVIADAIDQVHRGFYAAQAIAAPDSPLALRLSRVAREAWDRCGPLLPPPAAARLSIVEKEQGSTLRSPPIRELLTDGTALEDWLRELEELFAGETYIPWRQDPPATASFMARVAELVDAYLSANDEQRSSMRLSVSRFRRVCHRLSTFAARQGQQVSGEHGEKALTRCLAAEALLDQNSDWRDELLMLRDVRSAAQATGLPFESAVTAAARCSSERTASFLLSLLSG